MVANPENTVVGYYEQEPCPPLSETCRDCGGSLHLTPLPEAKSYCPNCQELHCGR